MIVENAPEIVATRRTQKGRPAPVPSGAPGRSLAVARMGGEREEKRVKRGAIIGRKECVESGRLVYLLGDETC